MAEIINVRSAAVNGYDIPYNRIDIDVGWLSRRGADLYNEVHVQARVARPSLIRKSGDKSMRWKEWLEHEATVMEKLEVRGDRIH